MIIKRRKDYEQYERPKHQRPWVRIYQVGDRLYRCKLIYYPAFLGEFNWYFRHCSLWQKLKYILMTIRHDMIMFYGRPAKTTEELDREADEFNARWQKMVQSGAIEAAFSDDYEPLNIDIWGDKHDLPLCNR